MDSTFDAGTADSSLTRRKTAGALLREARKLKGFSKEKVASHLNLMPSHILALESDAYNPDLEGRHFVDYLTAYANLVELNPRALKDLYRDNDDVADFSSEPYEPLVTRRQTYRDLSFSRYQADKPAAVGESAAIRVPGGNAFAFRIATVLALVCVAWLITARGIGPEALMASLKATFTTDSDEPFRGQIAGQGAEQRTAALNSAKPIDNQGGQLDAMAAESAANTGSLDRSRWSTPDWADTSPDSGEDNLGSAAANNTANSQTQREEAEQAARQNSQSDDAELEALLARARDYAERAEPAAGQRRPAKVDALHAGAGLSVPAATANSVAASTPQAATEIEDLESSIEQLSTTQVSVANQEAEAFIQGSVALVNTSETDRLDASVPALTSVVSGAGEDVMVFTFYDSCWIEVYDHQQNPLVMDTKMPGEVLRIAGKAPFEVRVGNSRVVGLTLNGRPVAIERHPTIASTELIVGRKY